MNKFLAIVKREYLVRVRTKMFVVMTILMPLLLVIWTVVPSLLLSIRSGGPTRIAIVDQSGKLYDSLERNILREKRDDDEVEAGPATKAEEQAKKNSAERMSDAAKSGPGGRNYAIEQVKPDGRSISEVKRELDERLNRKELDIYLIVPVDAAAPDGTGYELRQRNAGDIFSSEQLEKAINTSVRALRWREANISEEQLATINKDVNLKVSQPGGGAQGKAAGIIGFFFSLFIGLLIYFVLIMYGQSIMSAVVEEKETRIAEVLFSSVNPFYLILGKLIGISLVALTQLGLWMLAGVLFLIYGVGKLPTDVAASIPQASPLLIPYMLLFFLVGYFVFASLYAVVGSMVSTPQEGGQVSMPITLLLVGSLIVSFLVIRNPESGLSVFISMIPFCAPIVMPIRIVSHSAPFWQIALSLLICIGTGLGLTWFAARVYRVGMLMYGKRATLPEIFRWVRQR
jgi:ABC-2 type transport system permease protein